MKEACNSEQLEVFNSIFDFEEEKDMNYFEGEIDEEKFDEVFGGSDIDLCTGGEKHIESGARPDLYKKALFVSKKIEVIVHEAGGGDVVIEFKRKG